MQAVALYCSILQRFTATGRRGLSGTVVLRHATAVSKHELDLVYKSVTKNCAREQTHRRERAMSSRVQVTKQTYRQIAQ